MKKAELINTVLLILFPMIVLSQTLVPNGSFEVFTNCPNAWAQIYKATDWFQPHKYLGSNSVISGSSSDYFNSCDTSSTSLITVPINSNGFQYAKSGNGYIGLALYLSNSLGGNDGREYAEVRLIEDLVANKKYRLKYFVSMSNSSPYSITKFDAYLSHDSLLYTSNLFSNITIPIAPQAQHNNRISDTLNWVEVSESFFATGGERFLTLGNFHDGSVCDTLGTMVNSPNNCCYAYYYFDDISLVEDTITGIDELNKMDFSIFPNPSKNQIQISSPQTITEISIIDNLGKNLFSHQPNKSTFEMNIENFRSGIYLMRCKMLDGRIIFKKLAVY